jgi:hypothetical protein
MSRRGLFGGHEPFLASRAMLIAGAALVRGFEEGIREGLKVSP